MWLFVLAALGTAAVVFYSHTILETAKVRPAWNRARRTSVPAAAASLRHDSLAELSRRPINMSDEGDTYFPGSSSSRKLPADLESRAQALNEMWAEKDYYWVVVCKNDRVHQVGNIFYKHHIPLGETDSVQSRPSITGPFSVTCDECGKQDTYLPSDVLKCEMTAPSSFVSHPLFRG